MKTFYTLALLLSFPFAFVFSQNISNSSFTSLDLDITTNGRKINVVNPILRIQPIIRDGYTQDSNELILEFKSDTKIQNKKIIKQTEDYWKYPFNYNKFVLEFYNKNTNETIIIPIGKPNIEQHRPFLLGGGYSSYIYYKINLSMPFHILLESEAIEIKYWEVVK